MNNTVPPPDDNKTVPTESKRPLYDYSRSSRSDGHWYSYSNPLSQQPQPTTQQPQRSSRTRSRVSHRQYLRETGRPDNWAWVIIAVALLGMTLVTTMFLIFVLRTDNKDKATVLANDPGVEPTSIIYGGANPDNPDASSDQAVGGALDDSMVIQPWDGKERFTVLVMGLDNRPGEGGAACRTDTMMVISVDPINDRIGILSIPRDTYVEIPNFGINRINSACVLGNLYLNGAGPQLAMQTVQYNFGIRVNDYIMVDFNAFISIVDRIGGVDVMVEQDINDPAYPDMNYGYDPFHITAGEHHLDGATALKYARSRHSSDDIDRGRRQQQIIFAVREKVLSFNMLDDLITQALPIWNDINEGIETGLSLEQLVQLALYAKDIPDENIKNGVVDWQYLLSYKTENGADVLVPNRALIGSLMLEIFGEGYNR